MPCYTYVYKIQEAMSAFLRPNLCNGVRRIEPATAPNGMSDDTNEFS